MSLFLFFLALVLVPLFVLLLDFLTGDGSRKGDDRAGRAEVMDLPLAPCSDETPLRGDADLSL